MPSLTENLPSRIRKLSQPSNAQQAFQPVLEAMSNAVMAVEEAHADLTLGRVEVDIDGLGSPSVEIKIRDNGIGLDDEHYEAFLEIDTEFKMARGGKGVGRLYWLDAFSDVSVESRYLDRDGKYELRAFDFRLNAHDQIEFKLPQEIWGPKETGTVVSFKGLRTKAYSTAFPRQTAMVRTHTAAEFIAGFLSRNSPTVHINMKTENGNEVSATFPQDVADLVAVGPVELGPLSLIDPQTLEERGVFNAKAFLCDRKASRGMKLRHAVHFLGNGRTVESRKIDDLLGLGEFSYGDDDDLRLHVVVSSSYLDERTVESRTSFSIPESNLAEITRDIVEEVRTGFLSDQFEEYDRKRRKSFSAFLEDQPIFSFAEPDALFDRFIPASATDNDGFVRSLSVIRMRREQEREKKLNELIGSLVSGDQLPDDFDNLVKGAAAEIKINERSALAHHAARRKVVLDLLDKLIRRLRNLGDDKKDTYQLEKTLHSLLVPMQVRGDDPDAVEATGHDLWVIDERLTFTAGFASDMQFRKTIQGSESLDRSDILLWNAGFGLSPIQEANGEGEVDDVNPLSKVFIVELKKPGRTNYGPSDRLEDQVVKYVRQLQGGKIEGFGRRQIRVSPDCQFYSLVIADINSSLLDNELFTWDSIDNERGRRRSLPKINTIIDVLGWEDILSSARERNRALLSMAGLKLRANTAFEKSAEEAKKQAAEHETVNSHG